MNNFSTALNNEVFSSLVSAIKIINNYLIGLNFINSPVEKDNGDTLLLKPMEVVVVSRFL